MALKCVEFTSNGTWTPPVGLTAALLVATGSGGGASGGKGTGHSAVGAFGASSGEYVHAMFIPVSNGSPLTITIGAGGIGIGGGGLTNGSVGNPTSAGPWTLLGAGVWGAIENSQAGGGPNGAPADLTDGDAIGATGFAESPCHFGGNGGGCWLPSGQASPGMGTDSTGQIGGTIVGSSTGSGGGAGNLWPRGGTGGDGDANGANASVTGYGAGGGAGGGGGGTPAGTTGGTGANGYVAFFYMES